MSLTLKPKTPGVGGKELPPTEVVTRAGVPLRIRAALPADISLLADIYSHLSAQDMRFRFKQPIEHLAPEELKDLVDREAGMTSYLAFSGDTAIACATLVRDHGSDAAEVILSVRPDWKSQSASQRRYAPVRAGIRNWPARLGRRERPTRWHWSQPK